MGGDVKVDRRKNLIKISPLFHGALFAGSRE
jgi:hypothetical protein